MQRLYEEIIVHLVFGDILEADPEPLHVLEDAGEVPPVARFDSDDGGSSFFIRFLEIFESGDIVIRSEHVQEFLQGSRALREIDDDIFLASFEFQTPLLDLGQSFEVEISSGYDDDDTLPPDSFAHILKSIGCKRSGGLYDEAVFPQIFHDRAADPILRRLEYLEPILLADHEA